MSDSWESFEGALRAECAALQKLNTAALALTQVLVDGEPREIIDADRALNTARAEHQRAATTRRGMQARGFGTMTLQQVCQYAPRNLAWQFNQCLAELTCASISLGITITNNKTLIVAGLERVMKITAKIQEAMTERTGVYRRRGFVAPPTASVLVSSQV